MKVITDVQRIAVNIGCNTSMQGIGPHEHATRIAEAYDIIIIK